VSEAADVPSGGSSTVPWREIAAGHEAGHVVVAWYYGASEPLHSKPGSHRFDREQIGRDRYGAAHASVSRAVRRLEARGLVERYAGTVIRWAGLRLTDAGFEAAPVLDHQQTLRTITSASILTV
jgi:hypothetical protein